MTKIVAFILLLVTLSGCSFYRGRYYRKVKKVDYTKVSYFSKKDSVLYPTGIEFIGNELYDENKPYFSKRISFHSDTATSIRMDYFRDNLDQYFYLSWDSWRDSSIYVEQGFWDTVNRKHYNLEYNYNDDVLSSAVEVSTYQEYERLETVSLVSNEVKQHYHELARLLTDSINYISYPTFPDVSSCHELQKSFWKQTEFLNEDSTLSLHHIIDSVLLEGGTWRVNKRTNSNYYKEEVSEGGLITTISKRPINNGELYIKKQFYDPNLVINHFIYVTDTTINDTISRMEMTSKPLGKYTQYTFQIEGISPFSTGYKIHGDDSKLPIPKKEIVILRNKNTKLVELHATGVSSEGHQLEVKYVIDKKDNLKFLIKENTIPEVSGDLVYDLAFPHNNTFIIPRKVKNRIKRKDKYYSWWQETFRFKRKYRPEYFNKESVRLNYDRKSKIETRVKEDDWSKTIFEIHYL